ncbi:aldehyde dehydrogenase [Klebsiella pneumoniae]
MKKINHWINGKNVAGADYFHTTNPATGEVLAEVASGGEAEINQAVAAAKEAFPKWANLPMKERARLMRRLGDLIDQNVPEIAAMETADTGLPIHQTKNVLIPRASHNFEFFAEVCQQMNGKTYPVDDKMLNYTLVQPVGVCALVSPWNVPFMTATWKVAPCLALGNTAVLKMSELSPLTADRLGELALEAGIPAGVLNVVQGYGATAGDALVRHHDVRAVSFTGGTATGRNIMKNAGLKKYSMELGGKSPVLIFEDADIERALDAALFTIFSINGERCTAGSRIFIQQSIYPEFVRALDAALFTIFSINGERCTAGSRIFIQQSIYPEFVKRFAERANRLRVGDPTDPNTQVGALISQQHWEKVSGYIRLGIEEGATLLAGGADKPSDLPAHLKAGNFLRPTVLADVDNRMRVAQEEIFGPVACLLPFKDEAEGLRLANDVEYGLASYIWTQDVSKVLRLARGIEAGMVFVNTQNVRDLRQPFGGVKASGTGREGGEYSFEVFAEMKNVCISMGDHPIPKWGV